MPAALGALLLSLVIAGALIWYASRRTPLDPARPSFLSRAAFGLAVLALVALGLGIAWSFNPPSGGTAEVPGFVLSPFLASITLAFAGTMAAVAALVRRDRHWPTWVALAAGALVAGFWLVFAIGEFALPH